MSNIIPKYLTFFCHGIGLLLIEIGMKESGNLRVICMATDLLLLTARRLFEYQCCILSRTTICIFWWASSAKEELIINATSSA